MRAASCLLTAHTEAARPLARQWVTDPAHRGLALLTLNQLDALPPAFATELAQLAAVGPPGGRPAPHRPRRRPRARRHRRPPRAALPPLPDDLRPAPTRSSLMSPAQPAGRRRRSLHRRPARGLWAQGACSPGRRRHLPLDLGASRGRLPGRAAPRPARSDGHHRVGHRAGCAPGRRPQRRGPRALGVPGRPAHGPERAGRRAGVRQPRGAVPDAGRGPAVDHRPRRHAPHRGRARRGLPRRAARRRDPGGHGALGDRPPPQGLRLRRPVPPRRHPAGAGPEAGHPGPHRGPRPRRRAAPHPPRQDPGDPRPGRAGGPRAR